MTKEEFSAELDKLSKVLDEERKERNRMAEELFKLKKEKYKYHPIEQSCGRCKYYKERYCRFLGGYVGNNAICEAYVELVFIPLTPQETLKRLQVRE